MYIFSHGISCYSSRKCFISLPPSPLLPKHLSCCIHSATRAIFPDFAATYELFRDVHAIKLQIQFVSSRLRLVEIYRSHSTCKILTKESQLDKNQFLAS